MLTYESNNVLPIAFISFVYKTMKIIASLVWTHAQILLVILDWVSDYI